jgi:hypothetical protein
MIRATGVPRLTLVLVTLLGLAGGARAEENASPMTGTPAGRLLVGGSGRVMILAPDGTKLWEHKAGPVHDAWMLPTGNILYADGAVTEVTPEKQVVFQYKSKVSKGGGAYGCQRLADGKTLVAENSTGRILEIDPDGRIAFALQLQPAKEGSHNNLRIARKLGNGNYLACLKGAKLLREVTPEGKTVLEIRTPNITFAAFRTPVNTTYVSTLNHITEYDASGNKVWEFAATDVPGVTIRNMTGMHLLPTGNVAVGCYSAYKGGGGHALFEVTRDKKMVWRFSNPRMGSSLMAIQVLDKDGKPLPDACLR